MSLIHANLRPVSSRPPVGETKASAAAAFQMSLLDRAHQQAAVAALGQAALTGVDLLTLVEQAAVFVSQTLAIDFTSVYELAEDGETLRMIAGYGWNNGIIGQTTVRADSKSMAAYVLGSSDPVIVRDARSITAFEVPEFVRAHGVVSGMSVVIPGPQKPWGILEAQNRRGRTFVEDDYHFLQSVTNVISTAHARKQAEAERAHLAAFVEHNPNPVIELDAKGRVTYCNDAARVTTNAMQKQQPADLLPGRIAEIVQDSLATDADVLNEPAQLAGRTFSWSFFPLPQIERVHGYAVDVTDRLSLEAQLRQSQKMEAIGQLAAGVAHDFNNILTIMQGLTRRLGLSASKDQNPILEQLFETTERAASLTKQLLAFSRKQVLQPRVVSLGTVVDNMTRMLQRLIGEDVALSVERAENVPGIEADAAMLEQVVLNLAVNARDAMPRGGQLKILTDLTETTTAGVTKKWVRLRVTDTGCGMTPEVKARIFEPFFTTKEVGKGTGLGLATVFGIVRQHSGLIEVESEVGRGTAFNILLPPSDKELEVVAPTIVRAVPKRGAGETILLVEDEPILRELAHAILTDAGYKVIEAEESSQALDLWAQNQSIDLLLTDMVLPGGMTGRELALQLQQLKPNLKVIYTTGYSQDVVSASSAEAVNFLQKPYPPEMLTQTVRTCLDDA